MVKHLGVQPQTSKNAGERALIMAGVLSPPKPRKPRPLGLKYKREEDGIRRDIIKELRKRGYKVRRVEPCSRGSFSLGDLYVWKRGKFMTWLEVKSSTGVLSPGQLEFKEDCISCGVNYFVVRSVEESLDILRLL